MPWIRKRRRLRTALGMPLFVSVWLAIAALFILSVAVLGFWASTPYLKEAEQYIAQGNLKAAEIPLRNAIRDARPGDTAVWPTRLAADTAP